MFQRKSLGVLSISLLLASCLNSPPKETRQPAGVFGPTTLTEQEILKTSSSGMLELNAGRIIVDNDASFASKIDAIRSAKSGEMIRLVYYIYSTDHSSSLFSYELLEAAKRGVQVRLLVDYPTNFTNLDTFFMLEKKSGGAIQVRLYGRPTANMVRDAIFLSRPCPSYQGKVPTATYCSEHKWNLISKELAGIQDPNFHSDFFSGLLLSGIYSRSAGAIKVGLLMGGQIDPKKYTEGSSTPEDQKALREFLKLLFESKVKGDIMATLKVQIALMMYGDQLTPLMNEIVGRLPLAQMGPSSSKDWEHSTDFTHHKLLLVGNRFFQLGGRNIENAYHMKKNDLSAKYTFMDTDFAGEIRSGGDQIAKSYDDLFNFSTMTADIENAYKLSPNDFAKNPEAVQKTMMVCMALPNKTDQDRLNLETCLKTNLWKNGAKTLEARIEDEYQTLLKNRDVFLKTYLPSRVLPESWKSDSNYAFELSAQERNEMIAGYVENLHYDKRKPIDERKRLYGTFNNTEYLPWTGNEIAYGKNIHHLWMRGLESVCSASAKDKRERRVLIHSAYFLPPANLLRNFGKMMDGTWDCSRVRVTFLTNSFETTDLNYINIYARYEMMAFFDVYSGLKSRSLNSQQRSAKFEYFEYLPIRDTGSQVTKDSTISLHSKVSVFGDDMLVGSANFDVRSFYMDTNNGVYLRNVPDTVKNYLTWVDQMLADPTRVRNLTPDHMAGKITFQRLEQEDTVMFKALISRTKIGSKVSPKVLENAKEFHLNFARAVADWTSTVLSKDTIELYGHEGSEDQEKYRIQRQKEAAFNRALQLL